MSFLEYIKVTIFTIGMFLLVVLFLLAWLNGSLGELLDESRKELAENWLVLIGIYGVVLAPFILMLILPN